MRQLRRRTWLFVLFTLMHATAHADDTPWEPEVLRSGGRALAGAWFAFERAGSPKEAFAAADDVKTRGRPEYRGPALALEAHAAAVSGDYARAAQLARDARRAPIPEAQNQLLRTGSIAWSCLALLSPDGTRPESSMGPILSCLKRLAAEKPTTEEARLLKRQASALAVLGGWSVSFDRRSRADAERKKQLELALATADEAACGTHKDCPLGAVLQARIYVAAGEAESARRLLENMLGRTAKPGRIRGLLQQSVGDVIASPTGAPEELGLPPVRSFKPSLTRTSAVASAGVVSAGARVSARSWYSDAEASFQAEDCPRCMADLQVRRGALALDEGNAQLATALFSAARVTFDRLADRSAVERIAFPELAAVIANQPNLPPAVVAAGVELSATQAPLATVSTIELLLRLSERERYRDLGLALQSARVARELSQGPGQLDSLRESRMVLASLLRENGLSLEAAGELAELLAMPPPAKLPAKLWKRSVARELIAVYISLDDVPRAQQTLDQVCERCEDPDLLLAMRRFDQVVRVGQRTGDHFVEALGKAGQGELASAQPLVAAEVETVLARLGKNPDQPAQDLPFLRDFWDSHDPGAAAALRSQALSNRIQRLVGLAIEIRDYQAADKLVAGATPYFAKSPLQVDDRPWAAPAQLARIAEGLGQLATARTLSDTAVTALEAAYPLLPASFDESDLQDSDGAVYQDATRIRVLQGLAGQTNAVDSLEFLERWRARRALSRWVRARATSALLRPGAPSTPPAAGDDGLLTNVNSAAPLSDPFEDSSADAAALVLGTELGVMVNGVIARSRGGLLTAYYLDRQIAAAWVVGKNETVTLRRLPSDGPELTKLSHSMVEALKGRDAGWRTPAAALYERLVAPLEDLWPPSVHGHVPVAIVPYAALHELPFQALLRRDRPVVERYAFFYVPSLRAYPSMLELAARNSRVGLTVAFGLNDPARQLTHGEEEAMKLASKGFGFIRERATLESFREQLSRAAVIHVSAYAQLDEANPLATSFQLSDGAMPLSGLLGLRPTVRLLTLSAADRPKSNRLRGDELAGLSASALAGGIPSVLTSAWLVHDVAASAMLGSFYRRIKKGENLAVSLAKAQQEASKTTSPAVWSAFSLWGADQ